MSAFENLSWLLFGWVGVAFGALLGTSAEGAAPWVLPLMIVLGIVHIGLSIVVEGVFRKYREARRALGWDK